MAKETLKGRIKSAGSVEIDPAHSILSIARETGLSWIDTLKFVRSKEIPVWLCFGLCPPPLNGSATSVSYGIPETQDVDFSGHGMSFKKPFQISLENLNGIISDASRYWENPLIETIAKVPDGWIYVVDGNPFASTKWGWASFAVSSADFAALVPNQTCHLEKMKISALEEKRGIGIKQIAWKCLETHVDVYCSLDVRSDQAAYRKVAAPLLKTALKKNSPAVSDIPEITGCNIGDLFINCEDENSLVHAAKPEDASNRKVRPNKRVQRLNTEFRNAKIRELAENLMKSEPLKFVKPSGTPDKAKLKKKIGLLSGQGDARTQGLGVLSSDVIRKALTGLETPDDID